MTALKGLSHQQKEQKRYVFKIYIFPGVKLMTVTVITVFPRWRT
jgi:hypothetical protein